MTPYLDDRHTAYQRLRETDPVHWEPTMRLWVVTRHADVVDLLRDQRYSVDHTNATDFVPAAQATTSMVNLDPPRHTRVRALVAAAFTRPLLDSLETVVDATVRGLLDRVALQGGLDVVSELASPLALTVLAELLGIAPEDRGRFRVWAEVLGADREDGTRAALEVHGAAVRSAFAGYIRTWAAVATGRPGEGLIGALAKPRTGDDRLDQSELVANCQLIVTAGHETAASLVASGLAALVGDSERLERLRRQPELLEAAVEELLRLEAPVQLTSRVAREDVELGGRHIQGGHEVVAVLAAANRDPEQFPEPDVCDLGRSPNPHLAFGRGPHFCLGAPLARLQARIAFRHVLERFPRLRLAREPAFRRSAVLRSPTRLEVLFE